MLIQSKQSLAKINGSFNMSSPNTSKVGKYDYNAGMMMNRDASTRRSMASISPLVKISSRRSTANQSSSTRVTGFKQRAQTANNSSTRNIEKSKRSSIQDKLMRKNAQAISSSMFYSQRRGGKGHNSSLNVQTALNSPRNSQLIQISKPLLQQRIQDDNQRESFSHVSNVNLSIFLQKQKDDIKSVMMETNQLVSQYHKDQFDFQVSEIKKQEDQRISFKSQPYMQYYGKIKLKGSESPIKFEFLGEQKVNIILSLDDPSFTKGPLFSFKQQEKVSVHFGPMHEYCYAKLNYESADLSGSLLQFSISQGVAKKIQTSKQRLMLNLIKSKNIKINQMQFKNKINGILNDDFQANEALSAMENIQKIKRDRIFKDKDFITQNVEKAPIWKNIFDFNLNLQHIDTRLDQQFASKRRLLSDRQVRRNKITDINRWEDFRRNRDSLNQKRMKIFQLLLRNVGFLTIFKQIEIMKAFKESYKKRKAARDYKIKVRGYCKLLKWRYQQFLKSKGRTLKIRQTRFITNIFALTCNSVSSVLEKRAGAIIVSCLKQTHSIKQAFIKFKHFYNHIVSIQKIWRKQCALNKIRMKELCDFFDLEKEKLLVHFIKNKQHPNLVKKLKTMNSQYRDALLSRYFLKCRISHCDRFFEWRSLYLKMSIDQRFMVDTQINDLYRESEEFRSHTVKSFKNVKVPPQLGLNSEDWHTFQKIVATVYPQRSLQSKGSNFFMTQGSAMYEDQGSSSPDMIVNYQTLSYYPQPQLMAYMVLKASTLRKQDLDLVF